MDETKRAHRTNGRWIRRVATGLVLAGAVLGAGLAGIRSSGPAPRAAELVKTSADSMEYAGSVSCKSCHRAEFDAWRESHHARAEAPLDPETDRNAFGAKVAGGAMTGFEVGRDASGGFVDVIDENGDPARLRPMRWSGVAPLRQLLVERSGGRVQALDVAYDPTAKEWFGIFGDEGRTPGDWGHWTGRGMNWNNNCGPCHNTHFQKKYRPGDDAYESTYEELGIGCEACHGPRKEHAEAYASGAPERARVTRNPTSGSWVDLCGSCHARRSDLTGEFRPGEHFADHFALEIPDLGETFFADGQVHEEAYELTSFLGSRMHVAGVTCNDCHEPHSGKRRLPGNALCQQCHESGERGAPRIEPALHTFHAPESPGSQCVACHMPVTSYMQRHGRRDHGFTIPDPLLTEQHDVPNACSRCHDDKSVRWVRLAAERLYGERLERSTRRRARALAGARRGDPDARDELLRFLRGETNGMWRAVAATALAQYLPDAEVIDALIAAMRDPEPLVRAHSVRTLELVGRDPPERVGETLRRALEDPIRSVRVAAAWGLRHRVSETSRAGADLLAYLRLHEDQPGGQLRLGAYRLARGDPDGAVTHLQRAVSWDPRSAPLHHELAVALSQAGRIREAIVALETALRLDPTDGDYAYKLALAQSEDGAREAAIRSLEVAVELDPEHGRAWYNLGLARAHAGNKLDALRALERAEALMPENPAVPYARATILHEIGRTHDARIAAQRASTLDPRMHAAHDLLR